MANFRTDINAFIDSNLAAPARAHALAELARGELAKLLQSGKANRRYTTYVDGVEDPNEDHVKGTGGGVIYYKFSFIGDAVEFALSFLRSRTPKLSGKLSQSFWVSINGRYLPPGVAVNYSTIPPDAEVIIGNTAAYWRKADTNRRGGTTLNYKTPNILADCTRALNSEFGKSAVLSVRINDINFPGKYTPKISPRRARYQYQSPALVIKQVH